MLYSFYKNKSLFKLHSPQKIHCHNKGKVIHCISRSIEITLQRKSETSLVGKSFSPVRVCPNTVYVGLYRGGEVQYYQGSHSSMGGNGQ